MIFFFSQWPSVGRVLEPAPAQPCRRITKSLLLMMKELASSISNNLTLSFWAKQRTVPIMEAERPHCQALSLQT